MKDWMKALDKFLEEWKYRDEVVGVLVCGSYVTGSPSKHSDIDTHIILRDGTDWRERGNKVVDGFLVEYFANPRKQIEKYFEEDYKDGSQMAIIQFITGEIIFDDGTIVELRELAKKWYDKKFEKLPEFKVELNKYGFWDSRDNLQDAYDKKTSDFMFTYSCSLDFLITTYCKYLGYPVIKYHQAYKIFTDAETRNKYLLPDFPDKEFGDMCAKSLTATDPDDAMEYYEKLVDHLFKKLGGFDIRDWKLRSPLDLK
jgi:predicted nucleotidyltransferase